QCIKKATQEFERFEYCDARVAIEDFFWNDFCDNYLELVKARAYGEHESCGERSASTESDPALPPKGSPQDSGLYTVYHCLETLLRLFAPFVPHITEELYSHIFDARYGKTGSIHARGQWPKPEDYPYDEAAELSGMACVQILNVIRKAKSEKNVSIKFPVTLVTVKVNAASPIVWAQHIEPVLADLKAAANAEAIDELKNGGHQYESENRWFFMNVELAEPEEHKRNPDHEENHVLEGEVIHGPGNPDMSRHVVKLQVDSLPDTLERQK
ncbi:MAG: class I tRNA ligase family protein, partial [Pseudomonadota bacterium]|nr:class I tRNA ligase family protein [Pseudomonadota bacterium]